MEGCVWYQLKSPTMAVERGGSDGRMQFVTVPDGAMIELVGAPQQSGLIDVRFEGRVVAMFLRDIEDRGRQSSPKQSNGLRDAHGSSRGEPYTD